MCVCILETKQKAGWVRAGLCYAFLVLTLSVFSLFILQDASLSSLNHTLPVKRSYWHAAPTTRGTRNRVWHLLSCMGTRYGDDTAVTHIPRFCLPFLLVVGEMKVIINQSGLICFHTPV